MTITRKFRSVTWSAAVASAALGCYLVSYRVSAERNALEHTERQIDQARDDIVSLATEFETRSRMSQLERWSRNDLALSAPEADQFVEGDVQLASLFGHSAAAGDNVRQAASPDTLHQDRRVDDDLFETPDLDAPPDRVHPVNYVVPESGSRPQAPTRIALLEPGMRRQIAAEAAQEDAREANPD